MASNLDFVLAATYCPTSELVPLARHAELCGFDAVAVSDHLVVPDDVVSRYPYGRTGNPPFSSSDEWSDPWVAIAAMATATERLRFATNVYVLALRDPFSVAKAAATTAILSGNRVSLGVGVGWLREEFDLVGRRFDDRGARTTEMIELIRALWSGHPVAFSGRFHRVEGARMSPAPTLPVPILVGGESAAALRRAATIGDGYISVAHRIDTLAEIRTELDRLRGAVGRGDRPFEMIAVATDASTPDDHRRLAERGISGRIVVPWEYSARRSLSLEDKRSAMSRFAETIIQPVRKGAAG